jgi:glycosyltransferase involved in cell wall biosynthesis
VGRSACALVTPCWEEPFGLVIAEALSTGTPVASFATGGVPEVVGSSIGAGLVPRDDVVGLAHLAAGLAEAAASTPGFRRRIRADALSRFSLHRRAEVVEEVHEALVARHRPGLAGRAPTWSAPSAAPRAPDPDVVTEALA